MVQGYPEQDNTCPSLGGPPTDVDSVKTPAPSVN